MCDCVGFAQIRSHIVVKLMRLLNNPSCDCYEFALLGWCELQSLQP